MFYTDLKLICKTTEDVQEIENALKKWRYSDIPGYSVADNWIGKIPVNAGLTTYEGVYASNDYNHEGSINYINSINIDRCVYVSFETNQMPCFRMWSNIANKYWLDKVDKILYKVINHDWFYMTNDPECNYYFKVMNEEAWNVPHRIIYSEKMLEDHLMTFFRKKGISVEYDDVESLTEELSYFGVNAVLHRFEHKNLADWL